MEHERTEEEYILDSSKLENHGDFPRALELSLEGYLRYPNSYELAFMVGNQSYAQGDREKAYLYYLLAASLCRENPDDLKIITETAASADLSALDPSATRSILKSMLEDRLKLREYEHTYHFVSMLTFSDDPFLFKDINDTWLRYYQIILEITDCEKKRGLSILTADRFQDLNLFHRSLTDFMFAVRRIWFDIGDKNYLLSIYEKWDVSPEFLLILAKCAVKKAHLADVFYEISCLFEGCEKYSEADIIRQYADWYSAQALCEPSPYKRTGAERNASISIFHINCEDKAAFQKHPSANPEQTVAWILCATKENYVDEVLQYLQNQILPEGFHGSAFVVWNSKSMASGYNTAMNLSDAKYKIYIHQDTFIFDPQYTSELIRLLNETDFDLIGLAGSRSLPDTGRWWNAEGESIALCLMQDMVMYVLDSVTKMESHVTTDMVLLDGVLLATDTDVFWREDIFTDYHFYDVSACLEYAKKGMKSGLYNPGHSGVLHEVSVERGSLAGEKYEAEREVFIKHYL